MLLVHVLELTFRLSMGFLGEWLAALIDQGKIFLNRKVVENYKTEYVQGDELSIEELNLDETISLSVKQSDFPLL